MKNLLQSILAALGGTLRALDAKEPRIETLTVGQSENAFEVTSKNQIKLAPGVTTDVKSFGADERLAIMLDNGVSGALVCMCPDGFKGECGEPLVVGDTAVCNNLCKHTEIDRTTNCMFGFVRETKAMVLKTQR